MGTDLTRSRALMLKIDLNIEGAPSINVVALGGGTGLANLLSGLKANVGVRGGSGVRIADLSAVVAVSDDGGSSGRLRNEFNVLPPGDIRACMVALSEDSHLLSKLFRHRFEGNGDLAGHSFGNLFLVALSSITGDFAEAVRLSSEILASKGHIFPVTMDDVRISARLRSGEVVIGETNVAQVGSSIERLFLEPEDCHPLPQVLEAIEAADIITVGPGSLFTSLLPPLLVKGVPEAISASRAAKMFICNLMTQPGETDGLTAKRHLEIVREYAPDLDFDLLLVNDREISDLQREKYKIQGAEQIGVHGSMDGDVIEGSRVIHCDLLDSGEKVRHDPEKLASVILESYVAIKVKEAGPD